MKKWAYYNEIDPFAAHVLRNLIKDGVIAPGEVDERSISDVQPEDVKGFCQQHYFAGGGLWSIAARMAGWDDDRPLWTGSCPCQPFSVAGKGKGTADARHLWPDFHRLISECRPAVVVGEQVASKAGRAWLSGVFADLESVGYAGAGADLCAAGVGAPHIRQRLYWVAKDMDDADGRRCEPTRERPAVDGMHTEWPDDRLPIAQRNPRSDMADTASRDASAAWLQRGGVDGLQPADRCDRRIARDDEWPSRDMVDAEGVGRREGRTEHELRGGRPATAGAGSSDMADANVPRRQGRPVHAERPDELSPWSRGVEWRRGADGKERRVKSGVRLLVNGLFGRVHQLRLAGNAIVPQVAAEFIKAIM